MDGRLGGFRCALSALRDVGGPIEQLLADFAALYPPYGMSIGRTNNSRRISLRSIRPVECRLADRTALGGFRCALSALWNVDWPIEQLSADFAALYPPYEMSIG
jgi:hypothetical protein